MKNNSSVSVRNTFAAFRHKSFRYYWLGMAVSTTGSWMQNLAQPLLAYQLTNSPFLLALVGALQFLPVLLFSLFAGVLIDRADKKKILYITQAAAMLITLVVAILDATGHIAYWHLLISSTLIGFVNTFDMPARQSFVIELVGKEDLTNAIALNSAQFNLARIFGPALAGIIMGAWGSAPCFFINALSFGAVIIGLLFVKPYPIEKIPMKNVNIVANITDGLKFIAGKEILYIPILFLAIAATFAMNLNVLVPVFAIDVLNQQETGVGLLMSLTGVGALTGALALAIVSKKGPRKAVIYVFPLIVGVLVLAVGFTHVYFLTGITLVLISFFYMIFMASVNTTMQMNTTNEYRGRVMSVYAMVMAGSTPLGNLFAGKFADHFGARIGFIACGAAIIVLLIPLYLLLRKNKAKCC